MVDIVNPGDFQVVHVFFVKISRIVVLQNVIKHVPPRVHDIQAHLLIIQALCVMLGVQDVRIVMDVVVSVTNMETIVTILKPISKLMFHLTGHLHIPL
jgi:hypothetical protein